MFKSLWSLLLVGLLSFTISARPVFAYSQAERQAPSAGQVKAKISQFGIGKKARVTVQLSDKTKVKGYISEMKEDHFTIIDLKTGASTSLAYSDVVQVKKAGARSYAGLIGLGILAAVLLIVVKVALTPRT